jgi:Fe-S-cluster containining protein
VIRLRLRNDWSKFWAPFATRLASMIGSASASRTPDDSSKPGSPACNGSCCAVFYLPVTPDEMTPQWASHIAPEGDGSYIRRMAIPLSKDVAAQRAVDFGLTADWGKVEEGHAYTCRHWDTRTRLCREYEDRPLMCSAFPYGDKCQHCGWTNHVNGYGLPIDAP